jgi:RNA polymerase sigma factor (sigma-70 family)
MRQDDAGALSDAALLERVVAGRDRAAFEVLVWRHGGAVLGQCRRLLRHEQDAEDAFQAVFLILLRKAGSVGKRQALASWLYKVAFRAALRLRRRQQSRRERPAVDVAAADATPELLWRDLRPVLDEEVRRLPEIYRTPFILCYLQGLTNEDAARQLGCPRGTILSRLAWARQRLRDRLTRRGLALSAAALTTCLSVAEASAALPAALVQTTVNAASLFAAGTPVAGAVSAQAISLTQGVLRDMFLTKLKIVTAVLLGVGAMALGVAGLAAQRPPLEQAVSPGAERAATVEAPPLEPAPAKVVQGDPAHKPILLRVPDHGIQPQVVVDGKGVVHLLYFKGDPAAGDIYYVRSEDGVQFNKHPLRVNSQPGSATAVGTIRGAHLALGKNGRVHVSWNGSGKAMPRSIGQFTSPMLYARLNDAGTAFEEQRNLMTKTTTLDGGGSVAADRTGKVYVFWHAIEPDKKGEANRRVWVAVSTDEGKTFAAEHVAYDEPTGACGCCGMRAFADSKGNLYALYRGAKTVNQRDMHLLTYIGESKNFAGTNLHPWAINLCPMSSESIVEGPAGVVLGAWDTEGQVYFVNLTAVKGGQRTPVAAPGTGKARKHPALAVNAKGATLLAWTEGTGWNKGGSLAWQVFDRDGNPTPERGAAAGVPVWGLVAAFVRPDGRFVILY